MLEHPATPERPDDKLLFPLPSKDLPVNPIRWWAFTFPMGYLAGWGRTSAALLLALYFTAGSLVAEIVSHLTLSGGRILLALWNVGFWYYSYRLSRTVDSFIGPKPPRFGLLIAFAFTLIQWLLASAIGPDFF